MEYVAHIYARAKQGLQKDLRYRRRWSILIDGFVTDDGNALRTCHSQKNVIYLSIQGMFC